MRSSAVAVALGFAQLSACSHAHAHAKKAVGHRHGHLHDRGFAATVIETVLEYTTEIVYQYDDGATAPPPTSSSTVPATTLSTTSRTLAPAVFIEKSSSSTPVTTATPPPKVEPPPASVPPPPAPVTSAAPAPVVAPDNVPIVEKPGERVVVITNLHTAAVSTYHDDTPGKPTPTSAGAPLTAGTMAPGAVATFAVRIGWVGNIAYGDANSDLAPGSSSLLELNYNYWDKFDTPKIDLDVSFVDGYTLPATCQCGGQITGCSVDLHAKSTCPQGQRLGAACINPVRAAEAATDTAAFFSACRGAAWTYVNDGSADMHCEPNQPVSCCIGAACTPNPNQRG